MASAQLSALGYGFTTTTAGSSLTIDNPAYSGSLFLPGGTVAGTLTTLFLVFDLDQSGIGTGTIVEGTANGVVPPAGFTLRTDVLTTAPGVSPRGHYLQIWTRLETGPGTATMTVTWPSAWLATCSALAPLYGLWPNPALPIVPIPVLLDVSAAQRTILTYPPDTLVATPPVLPDTTNEWVAIVAHMGWPTGSPVGALVDAGYYFGDDYFFPTVIRTRYAYRAFDPGETPVAPTFTSSSPGICSVTIVVPNFVYVVPPETPLGRRGFGMIRGPR